MNGRLWVRGQMQCTKDTHGCRILNNTFNQRNICSVLLMSCTKAASTNWRSIMRVALTLTCHQGALCWALLHEHHVLKQRAVSSVPACSCPCLGQVGSQMATGEKRRAEGERWLQAPIRLGWGHLEKSGIMDKSVDTTHSWRNSFKRSSCSPYVGSSGGCSRGGQPQGDVG